MMTTREEELVTKLQHFRAIGLELPWWRWTSCTGDTDDDMSVEKLEWIYTETMMYGLVARAEKTARAAHSGQTRRDAVTPYIVHPEDVASRVGSATEKAVAWLHDVLEDTPLTSVDLQAQGFPPVVIAAVEALTRSEHEPYLEFIHRLRSNPLAVAVKRADIASNLADTPTDAQRQKYASALEALEHY